MCGLGNGWGYVRAVYKKSTNNFLITFSNTNDAVDGAVVHFLSNSDGKVHILEHTSHTI